jgi:hypothetical protein
MPGTRRRPGRLGRYVDGYRVRLLELGYSPLSVSHSLAALGHLGRWMDREGLDVDQLDRGAVEAFLAAHANEHGNLPTAGVMPLLDYLRGEGSSTPNQPRGALRSTGCSLSTASGCSSTGRSHRTRCAATCGWPGGFLAERASAE